MGDDENDSAEEHLIVSAENVEYEPTATIAETLGLVHGLVHGKKKDLGMLRSLTEDLLALVVRNPGASVDADFSELDMPPGWTVEGEACDDEE